MAPTRRLLYFVLVTMVTFVCLAHSAQGIGGDNLSSKIDADLFLEDEGLSGDGDLENGSGISGRRGDDDDEDSKVGGDNKIDNTDTNPIQLPNPGSPDKKSKDEDFGTIPDNNNGVDRDNVFDKKEESQASFFSQPGILAAIICGAIVGLLCAILLVMFIVYRMRKKDEGSYVLDDSKRTSSSYGKSKEFFA